MVKFLPTLVVVAVALSSLASLTLAVKEPLVAPYVDVTRMDGNYLVDIHKKTGLTAVTLAFALGGTGGCAPAWGGTTPLDDPKITGAIKAFQAIGGKVIVATGGAMGPYLEAACSSPASLAAAYKKTLNSVNSVHLDIDIEASVGVDNMNAALKILQGEMPDLTVSFTLMVQGDDYGVTDALGVGVLKSAASHGVRVDIVNPMTMEFGTKLASWGDAVIAAAEATHAQMKQVWPSKSDAELYAMLGVTPMIGRNFNGKVFEVAHAKKLVAWAKEKKIGHLAYWSLGRDNGKCAGGGISADCSSTTQSDLEFAKIFNEYSGTKLPGHFEDPVTKKPSDPNHPDDPTTRRPSDVQHHDHPECGGGNDNKHFPHETDCDKYYWCYSGTAHLENCNPGTVWDPKINSCNWKAAAGRTDCK